MRRSQFLFAMIILLLMSLSSVAQEKVPPNVLTNSDVISLIKAGLGENIILEKIKNSQCDFDTSSAALVSLKESGVSDNLLLAMIEAKSNAVNPVQSASPQIVDIAVKNAIGKRKVFIQCDDAKSLSAISNVLGKNGFEVVVEPDSELIIKFDYQVQVTSISTAASKIFGDIGNQNQKQKWGRFEVLVKSGDATSIIFSRENQPRDGVIVKIIQNQAEDFAKDFVKEMKKAESPAGSTKN